VDKRNRIYIWGENTSNLRLRKAKLFHAFNSVKQEVYEIAMGKRHGLIRTSEGIYGWGDGTYGELGI
jgi:alpha-tubulin suppressor-like RCC1 family protein